VPLKNTKMENDKELALDVESVKKRNIEKKIGLHPNDIEALLTTGHLTKRFQAESNDFDVEARLMGADDAVKYWETLDEEEDTNYHHLKENMKPVEGVDGLFMRTIQVNNINYFDQGNVSSMYVLKLEFEFIENYANYFSRHCT